MPICMLHVRRNTFEAPSSSQSPAAELRSLTGPSRGALITPHFHTSVCMATTKRTIYKRHAAYHMGPIRQCVQYYMRAVELRLPNHQTGSRRSGCQL